MRMIRIVIALVCAACAVLGHPPRARAEAPAADPKAHFRERGRVGVIGAITEDLWKGGVVFEHEHFEAQVLVHLSFTDADNRDVHSGLKLGARLPLGTLNYVAFGAEAGSFAGARADGNSLSKSYELGPYLSIQRYFAATPVMLNLWVNPVQYAHGPTEDSPARDVKRVSVFQTGGFGLAYLFF
jgi:hypothetical protein